METVILNNSQGMTVELIDFGARIKSIKFPVNGVPTDMVLTYANGDDYLNDNCYLGATCGRVCGRIAEGKLTVDGQFFQLDQNERGHTHHGGYGNMAKQYWSVDAATQTANKVTFCCFSADKAQGFPGAVTLSVEYVLSDDNRLAIHFYAETTRTTPINLTNHSYFNLGEDDIYALTLKVNAAQFLAQSDGGIPTGELEDVAVIGADVRETIAFNSLFAAATYPQIMAEQGLDHCFVLADATLNSASVELASVKNRVKLRIFTDQPAALVYTGKYLEPPLKPFAGVCIECQGFTDATSHAHFPSILIGPTQPYRKTIIYQFDAIGC